MPNLSPTSVRAKYALYDGKICTGDEAAECIMCLTRRVETTGNHIANVRGDSKVEFKDKEYVVIKSPDLSPGFLYVMCIY